MRIFKQCSCGLVHLEVPSNAKFNDTGDNLAGYYWNCHCGSTLFMPVNQMGAA